MESLEKNLFEICFSIPCFLILRRNYFTRTCSTGVFTQLKHPEGEKKYWNMMTAAISYRLGSRKWEKLGIYHIISYLKHSTTKVLLSSIDTVPTRWHKVHPLPISTTRITKYIKYKHKRHYFNWQSKHHNQNWKCWNNYT